MGEEGYIKFNCDWIKAEPLPMSNIVRLSRWRDELYRLGLVGAYDNGVGFGNISERVGESGQFMITGSATGGLEALDGSHYTIVRQYDLEKNCLSCEGPIKASSESMTHGAIYQAAPEVNGVIHVHDLGLWERLLDRVPTTSREVEYGTPEIAREMMRLIQDEKRSSGTGHSGIIVMAGHKEGIVSYGRSLDEAGETLFRGYFK